MKICTYGNMDAGIVIVQPVDEREIQMIPSEISLMRKLTKKDFCLLACVVDDWNRDLSPWRASLLTEKLLICCHLSGEKLWIKIKENGF